MIDGATSLARRVCVSAGGGQRPAGAIPGIPGGLGAQIRVHAAADDFSHRDAEPPGPALHLTMLGCLELYL